MRRTQFRKIPIDKPAQVNENRSHYDSSSLNFNSTMNPQRPPPAAKPEMPKFADGSPRLLESVNLLGTGEQVLISHGGETYRLRRTRQGKLILTK